jgi:hypothetical protein
MRSSVVSTRAGRLAWGEREGRRWIRLSCRNQAISDISGTSSCPCIVRTDCPSEEGRLSSGIEPCRRILRSLGAQQRRPRSPQTSTRKHSRNSESFRRRTRSQVCNSALTFHSLPGPAADSRLFVRTLFWLQLPSFVHPALLPSPCPSMAQLSNQLQAASLGPSLPVDVQRCILLKVLEKPVRQHPSCDPSSSKRSTSERH